MTDVRKQFEAKLGRVFDSAERVIFKDIALDFCKRRCESLEREAMRNAAANLSGQVLSVESEGEEDALSQVREYERAERSRLPTPSAKQNFPNPTPVVDAEVQKKLLSNFNAKHSTRENLISSSKEASSCVEQSNMKKPSKFTFKRVSENVNPSLEPPPACNSKKAKFRQENPLSAIQAPGVNRNRLALCDAPQALEETSKTSNSKKRKKPASPASSPSNTVGVWLQCAKVIPPSKTKPAPRKFSFTTLNISEENKDCSKFASKKCVKNTQTSDNESIQIIDIDGEKSFNTLASTKSFEGPGSEKSSNILNDLTDISSVDEHMQRKNNSIENINGGYTLGAMPKNKFGL